ncbi:IMPACT family protein [Pseudotenacibaculum haliotis]|uniref:IMPACT family protein n=1 Tax=Pseudotenacibaculum haliotis TaxID=1862138 RepID=A0ABW5LQA3_9FLAO
MKDTYKTIASNSEETLFKDRNSKFYGYAFPVRSEEDIKNALEGLKKQHHSARHFCYAWQLGTEKISYRANDDGEPSNSAGMPIYGQIQSFDLTNVLVVSVRYFGGVKLGVGGLINAYRSSARLAIEASQIIEKTIDISYQLTFGYELMSKAMKIIKENRLQILSQKLEEKCEIQISVRKSDAVKIFEIFDAIYQLEIRQLEV